MVEAKWENKLLSEILTVRHGKAQHDVLVEYGKYPILATGGQIGWANRPLYTKPSVLIGRKGTINRPQYTNKPFWTIDTLFYTEIHEDYIPKYIYYLFKSINWLGLNEASGVPSLSSKNIERLQVKVPSKNVQTKIASVLSDMDELIESLEKVIDKKRKVKQGTMQQLLTGKKRLPGFTEEWQYITFDKILSGIYDYTANGSFKALRDNVKYYNRDNYAAIVRTTDLNKTKFQPERFTDKTGYEFLGKTSLHGGELIMANVGSLGQVFRVPKVNYKMTLGPNTYLLTLNANFDTEYFYHFLKTNYFKKSLNEKVGSSTLKAINRSSLKSIQVNLPSNIKEQQAIATILSDMDTEIDLLENKLEKYEQMKEGMMQQLLTGRIRLV